MAKKGENIYKRKDGRWEGRYLKETIDEKKRYGYVYGKTYREAKDKLLKALIRLNITTETNENYFEKWSESWLDSLKPRLKHSSIMKYTNLLKLYLIPHIGKRDITQITYPEVYDLSEKLLTSGGKNNTALSPKTVSGAISVLKNVFEYASKCEELSLINIGKITIKQPQSPMRVFSNSEQTKLSSSLCMNLNNSNLGILICLYTGIRIGELCALKWSDVIFEDHCIWIHKTMQRVQTLNSSQKTKVIISEPKSSCSIRKIPLPDELFEILMKCKQEPDSYILTGSSISYIEPRTMQNRFKAILEDCKIENANFHALRHTFATRCIELGFDIKSLSEILGHASVNITLNRYVHPSMEQKQKNMNKLSNLLAVS